MLRRRHAHISEWKPPGSLPPRCYGLRGPRRTQVPPYQLFAALVLLLSHWHSLPLSEVHLSCEEDESEGLGEMHFGLMLSERSPGSPSLSSQTCSHSLWLQFCLLSLPSQDSPIRLPGLPSHPLCVPSQGPSAIHVLIRGIWGERMQTWNQREKAVPFQIVKGKGEWRGEEGEDRFQCPEAVVARAHMCQEKRHLWVWIVLCSFKKTPVYPPTVP